MAKLGKVTLREAVEFFHRHHRIDVPRLPLTEIWEQFARSQEQTGLSPHCVFLCRKLAEAIPGLLAGASERVSADAATRPE